MINDRLAELRDYPFRRLADLLDGVPPPPGVEPAVMSIGEPRHPVPRLAIDALAGATAGWGRYPPTVGTADLRAACAEWLARRYALPAGAINPDLNVLPSNGSREALFTAALLAAPSSVGGARPAALIPNPFYQVYAGAAVLAGAEPVFLPAAAETGFLPDFAALPEGLLRRTALAYLCTPSNPQGAVADLDYLRGAVALARRHDFILAVDSCYSEIYRAAPPPGVLEACRDGEDLECVLDFHSLSKRSGVPGLRSGFIAGGARLMAEYARLRSYAGGASPLPVMAAAAALWRDEAHVEEGRALYRRKFAIAERLLGGRGGFRRPEGGFYLWLEAGDGEAAARRLWAEAGVKAMPGAYLARDDSRGAGRNPGAPYIRMALVHDPEATEAALSRAARVL